MYCFILNWIHRCACISFKLGILFRLLYCSSEQVSGSTSYISDNPADGPDLVGTKVLPWVILFHLSLQSSLIAWDHLLIHPSLLLRSDGGIRHRYLESFIGQRNIGTSLDYSREERKKENWTSMKYRSIWYKI